VTLPNLWASKPNLTANPARRRVSKLAAYGQGSGSRLFGLGWAT
jgi:hypothetical protein